MEIEITLNKENNINKYYFFFYFINVSKTIINNILEKSTNYIFREIFFCRDCFFERIKGKKCKVNCKLIF